MRLLGCSKKKHIDQDKDGDIVPKLEAVQVVLVHCNLVNNNYPQASKVSLTFAPNKQFGQLINISPHSLVMLNTTKHGKKLMDTATKTGIDAAKTASKRVVQKLAEAIEDLIGHKIADKITSVGKSKSKEKKDETN